MTLPAIDRPRTTAYDPHSSGERGRAWRAPSRHPAAGRRSRAWIAPAIAALVACGAALHAIDALSIGGFYDDAFYVILAKSLATGHGYRNLNLPGAPFATHFPPGYPALLALLWMLYPSFPANLILFKIANALLITVAAFFAARLAEERFGLGALLSVGAAIAGTAATPSLYVSSMLMSEPLFLALLLPLLLRSERAVDRSSPAGGTDWRTAISLGAAIGVATLVRTQGIVLLPALLGAYGVRRRWRDALAAGAAATIVMAPWFGWIAAHDAAVPALMRGDYGSYGGWFVDGLRVEGWSMVAATAGRNALDVLLTIALRLRIPGPPAAVLAASLSVLILGAAGTIRLARSSPVTGLFLAGYLGMIVVWPFPPVRFLLGIWVLLMLLLAAGAHELVVHARDGAAPRGARLAVGGVAVAGAAVLATGALAYNVTGYSHRWWGASQFVGRRFLEPKLAWAGEALAAEPDAVIATEHDEGAFYLYTGRHAVPATTFTVRDAFVTATPAEDSATFATLTRRYDARYALLTSPRMRAAAERNGATGYSLLRRADGAGPWVYTLPPASSRR